jgi:hypothetical protein
MRAPTAPWACRLAVVVLLALVAGCAKQSAQAEPEGAAAEVQGARGSPGSQLAYAHQIEIELAADAVLARGAAVQAACEQQAHGACSLLGIQTDGGDRPRAVLELRAVPEAIAPLIAIAAADGTTRSRRTSAEDLADAVAEVADQRAFLDSQRAELVRLLGRRDLAVSDLLALSERVARIDAELHALAQRGREQQRRIETNHLTLTLVSPPRDPAQEGWFEDTSLDLRQSIADGIVNAVDVLTYVLPLLLVGFPIALLTRWAWRRATGAARRAG